MTLYSPKPILRTTKCYEIVTLDGTAEILAPFPPNENRPRPVDRSPRCRLLLSTTIPPRSFRQRRRRNPYRITASRNHPRSEVVVDKSPSRCLPSRRCRTFFIFTKQEPTMPSKFLVSLHQASTGHGVEILTPFPPSKNREPTTSGY
jgi:hypothetical protein